MFSSFRYSCRVSFRTLLIELCARIGLGSSLGAGDGSTVATDLGSCQCMLDSLKLSMRTHFWVNVVGTTEAFEMLARGVGRTGVPAPIIHDFCRDPPNSVLSVAFEDSTSLSDRAV